MKIRQSFEQAICILLLIGVNESHIKSHELSEKLNISDSYLKKITRQLVVAGFIESRASKRGGFLLKKELDDITLFDIFEVIEGKESFVETTHLVERVFENSMRIKETEDIILDYLHKAEEQYKDKLKEITLSDIVHSAQKSSD
ncbi:MAG: Rrf2 family transcriptional regulator [Erysipelotrichales bacterium]|nr:Rrf2 family transcriptional regulator [Erysipelotrichales bacterium]